MIYGKMVATKNKIVKEFIEKYIIIALIPWVIYRIGIYILCDIANKTMEKQQFSIESILDYSNIATDLSYKILIFSIILVLSNFLIVFFSSKLIFKKYKIKREDVNSIMKVIIILQVMFVSITTLYYYVSYNNEICFNSALGTKFEWLAEQNMKSKTNNYDVNKYVNNVREIYQIHLSILIITNFCCTLLCIFWQREILKYNSK